MMASAGKIIREFFGDGTHCSDRDAKQNQTRIRSPQFTGSIRNIIAHAQVLPRLAHAQSASAS